MSKNGVKTLYKKNLLEYIIIVDGQNVPSVIKRSSFSPLSYIIQEAVNLVYCFLNFKRLFVFQHHK